MVLSLLKKLAVPAVNTKVPHVLRVANRNMKTYNIETHARMQYWNKVAAVLKFDTPE